MQLILTLTFRRQTSCNAQQNPRLSLRPSARRRLRHAGPGPPLMTPSATSAGSIAGKRRPHDHIVHAGLPAGRITDDSEQAFSIAQAVIEAKARVTLAAAVKGLTAWYDRVDGDNSPYVGPSTRRGHERAKTRRGPAHDRLMGRYQRRAHAHRAHRPAASGRYRGRRCSIRSPSACRPISPSRRFPGRRRWRRRWRRRHGRWTSRWK